jgi:PAS domain S-box-containing protein
VLKSALSIRALSAHNMPQNEDEFVDKMIKVFPYLIKKHNESIAEKHYRYIVEHSNSLFSIQREGKTIYANNTFKDFFGVHNLSELDKHIQEGDIAKILTSPGSNQKIISKIKNTHDISSEYFIHTYPLKDGETLIGIVPLSSPLQTCEKRLLNRMSFIELLKNAFVIHNGENESILVVIIYIENSEKIINDNGQNIYNDICKEILILANSHFGQDAEIAQWHRDVYSVICPGALFEELKQMLEKFHQDVTAHIVIEKAVPSLNSFVIDMQGTDLNNAIGIIDHIYNRELLKDDIAALTYHEVSAVNNALDDKEQILNYLEKLMFAKSPIKLLNFYKGIRITTPARIVKIANGLVYTSLEKMQGYAMKLEQHTVIQATNLPYDLQANVKIVDVGKKITVLSHFQPLKASANNRQYIRIQSDHRMHVTITSSKRVMAGTVMDISIKSIACKINASTTLPDIGSPVMLQFSLPLTSADEGMVNMSVGGKIQYVQSDNEFMKVVVDLNLEEPFESYMIEYIYNRQQALINEIKMIANKL